jgi:N-carbamoyl-L-amino-acid hydrolase
VRSVLHVDAARLRRDLEELAAIGATPAGGVNRPALGEAHLEARRWFLERAAEACLETCIDSAANHSAVLRSPASGGRTLLLGSHLDTVPNGGRFDGALGVAAALEVLRRVAEEGLELHVDLEAIDFTDEEGTLVGLLGSEAVAGTLRPDAFASPRGGADAVAEALARAGLTPDGILGARREPAALAGYLELHVEQGPRLEGDGIAIGIVSEVVGSRSFEISFLGRAAHAGTTPIADRADAGLGAASFVVATRDLLAAKFPGRVATVGRLSLSPGAFNVVPGRADLALEFRSPTAEELDRMEEALLEAARTTAAVNGLEIEIRASGRWEPTPLDAGAQSALERSAAVLGLSHVRLSSGAGHDAQALAHVTRSAMVFVPSAGGVSHDPAELTTWSDCANGADVLLNGALELARSV